MGYKKSYFCFELRHILQTFLFEFFVIFVVKAPFPILIERVALTIQCSSCMLSQWLGCYFGVLIREMREIPPA